MPHSKLKSIILSSTAVVFAVAFAAPAQAQSVGLYGAGSTLAEKVYRDIMNCYGEHGGGPGNGDTTANLVGQPSNCNTATPYRANVGVLYLGVGSGNGKKGFDNHDASHFTDGPKAPDNPPVVSTTDFGVYYGTGTGAGWVKDATDSGPFFPKVSYAGSDDPLTSTDLGTYNAAAWGVANQVPGFITTIAFPYNPTSGTWTEKGAKPSGGGNSGLVDLTTNTLCGIFSGAITDWSDPAITADNHGTVLGTGAITVVYRSDGSGTTFLASNGLINQCAESSHPIPASWQSATGNTPGAGNNSFFINAHTAGVLPANFVGANGSGGVKTQIDSTPGSVGYLSPDFVLPVDTSLNAHKALNLQTYITFHTAVTPVFKAPTGKNGTPIVGAAKAPSFSKLSCPVGTAFGQSPDGICADNPLNWGQTFPKPLATAAYPIGGFTFIDTYSCYASAADVDALAGITPLSLGFFRWYYGTTTENALIVKNQLIANGFSVIPGGWLSGAKKLLTTNKPTKILQAGTASSHCTTASGA